MVTFCAVCSWCGGGCHSVRVHWVVIHISRGPGYGVTGKDVLAFRVSSWRAGWNSNVVFQLLGQVESEVKWCVDSRFLDIIFWGRKLKCRNCWKIGRWNRYDCVKVLRLVTISLVPTGNSRNFHPFLWRCLFFPEIHADNDHHAIDLTYCTWSSNSSQVEEFRIRWNWHAISAIRITREMRRLSTLPSAISPNYDNGASAQKMPAILTFTKLHQIAPVNLAEPKIACPLQQ